MMSGVNSGLFEVSWELQLNLAVWQAERRTPV